MEDISPVSADDERCLTDYMYEDGEESTCTIELSYDSDKNTDQSSSSAPADRPSRKRKFVDSWGKSFPWLEYNKESSTMFCKQCKKAKATTVWASTGCESLKKDAIVRHAHSAVHRQAVGTTQLQTASTFSRSHQKATDSLVILCQNVYWLAKENVAILKASSLHDLAKLNGVSIEITSYQGKMAAWQFVEALNQVVEDQILQELKSSPFFSLMADESTDISVSKNLLLYVRYLKQGKSLTRYLKLASLTQGNAETIYSTISDFLSCNNIEKLNLVGWASDGCEVMLGIHSGVQSRLKQDVPYLTSIHCVAHREALASRQAAAKVPYLQKVESILRAVYSYFSRSSV